jgi:hypothetical protein
VISSLQALGLEPDADERDVRRAYARRVKAIDPATDPRGFQTLREHYEAALSGVRARAQAGRADVPGIEPPGTTGEDGEPGSPTPPLEAPTPPASCPMDADLADPLSPPVPAATAPVQANRWAEADGQVFADFVDAAAQAFSDEAAARAALERALEDPRLVNLEARAGFEWRVAQRLAQGWRPGHQFLFRAACDAFNWERERSRLFSFGLVGAMLDAAITEKLVFYHQPEYQFALQRGLVVRLREDPLPPNDVLATERERLQMLVQRFPHWLRIVTSSANVDRWLEALQALAPPPIPSPGPRAFAQPASAPPAGTRGKITATDWSGFLLLILILVVLSNMSGRVAGPSPNPPYQVPAATAAALETLRKLTAPEVQPQSPVTLNPARPQRPAAPASNAVTQGPFANPLTPSRELPTLSGTDPANAPWRNGINYELVPRNPAGPASTPLLRP